MTYEIGIVLFTEKENEDIPLSPKNEKRGRLKKEPNDICKLIRGD